MRRGNQWLFAFADEGVYRVADRDEHKFHDSPLVRVRGYVAMLVAVRTQTGDGNDSTSTNASTNASTNDNGDRNGSVD